MDSDFPFKCLSHSQQENNTMGKEMAEKRTSTMSVELAIQRELAFRRKIEELQLQPYVDSGDEIMPVQQVQFPHPNPSRPNLNSSPRLSGREQLASLSSLECLPSPIPSQIPSSRPHISFGPRISERKQLASSSKSPPPQQLQAFNGGSLNHQSANVFCIVCQVPCSGSVNYKQHLNGKKHKLKLKELNFGRTDGGDICAMANQKLWCELCKIWCTDDNLLKLHLAGQKHKKMQAKLERATAAEVDIVEEKNWCGLCGIGCSSKELLQLHFNGKKHQAELRKLECAQKGREEAQNQQKRCKFGNIWCEGKNLLQMHLIEKKKFLYKVEVKKRQWQDLIRDEGNS
ncbi:Uncharacterized protein TCM_014123 isoform 2 [Theobroma cacao]|uniref:Uncharacterized protein isoform 2 n=1 Tax=Theobroma cacao TaxID=3641 RepID=A0A061FXE5_THECC|nr:Uncharacterized protein TCM_014123 isoform 2 [Theobroma cacao]